MKIDENAYTTLREANVERQKEWDQHGQITPSYRSNELAGEVGEALEKALDMLALSIAAGRLANTVKKLDRERMGIRGSRVTVETLAEELADVVICADLLAASYGIDLDEATRNKFNATSKKVGLLTRYYGTN